MIIQFYIASFLYIAQVDQSYGERYEEKKVTYNRQQQARVGEEERSETMRSVKVGGSTVL
jgi:hypothetical protein